MAEKQAFQGFFSYAHHDAGIDADLVAALTKRLADRVAGKIINADFAIWRDVNNLRTGQRWNERIGEAVRQSRAFIILMTPKWFESKYCRKEYQIFKEVEKGVGDDECVVPILARSVEKQLQYFDKEQREIYEELSQRQYKKFIATTFLALTTDEREVLIDAIADDIEDIIGRLRQKPSAAPDGVASFSAETAAAPENPDSKSANILLAKGATALERCKIRGLAAVELFPAQVGRGNADVGFDLSCGVARICGVPVTIRSGEMSWDCGGGQLDPDPEARKRRGKPYLANDGVKLTWNAGDTLRPNWRIEAEADSIGNVSAPPDFEKLVGLVPGCTVTATFGVWRPNIEASEVADTKSGIAAFDPIAIPLDVDLATMSLLKKRIVTRLATDGIKIEGEGEDEAKRDFIVLCRHTVTFVAAPTE